MRKGSAGGCPRAQAPGGHRPTPDPSDHHDPALRRFGPELHGRKPVLATVLLVAVAATLVGAAATTASSAADYRLQSGQLGMMRSMRGTCDTACLTATR
jgi:hypothetical protein